MLQRTVGSLVAIVAVCALVVPAATAAPSTFQLDPSHFNYGQHAVGSTTSQVFTVTNRGSIGEYIDEFSLYDPDGLRFWFGTYTCLGVTLAAGASCTIEILYQPTDAGRHTARFCVDRPQDPSYICAKLSGRGT